MSEGDLLTVNSGISHEIFDGSANGLQIIVSVDPALLYREKTEAASVKETGRYSSQLVLKSEEEWDCFHMELYRVLMYLARHKREAGGERDLSSPEAVFTKCIEILHQEYGQTLSVKNLADRVGVSEPTVYRMFQKQLGVSYTSYLNSVRVSAACGYLENSELSITEIADCCGFSSLSNFYRAFHIYKGLAPREYRREHDGTFRKCRSLRQNIMDLNQFQGFWELPYDRDELLIE